MHCGDGVYDGVHGVVCVTADGGALRGAWICT